MSVKAGIPTRTYCIRTLLSYPLCHWNNSISDKCQWNHNFWPDRGSNPYLLLEKCLSLPHCGNHLFENKNIWQKYTDKKEIRPHYTDNNFSCIFNIGRKIIIFWVFVFTPFDCCFHKLLQEYQNDVSHFL